MAYKDMKYNKLRKMAVERGTIDFSGGNPKKPELIEALKLDDARRNDEAEAAIPPGAETLAEVVAEEPGDGFKRFLVEHKYNNNLIVRADDVPGAIKTYMAARAILGTNPNLMKVREL